MCSSLPLPARIGKMKRRKPEEGGQVCPLCSAPLAGSEEEMSRHVEQCLIQVVLSRPRPPPLTASLRSDSLFQISSSSCSCRPVTFSLPVAAVQSPLSADTVALSSSHLFSRTSGASYGNNWYDWFCFGAFAREISLGAEKVHHFGLKVAE